MMLKFKQLLRVLPVSLSVAHPDVFQSQSDNDDIAPQGRKRTVSQCDSKHFANAKYRHTHAVTVAQREQNLLAVQQRRQQPLPEIDG